MKCNMLRVLLLLSCILSVKTQTQFNTKEDDVEEDVNQNLDLILENNNNIMDISSTVDDLDGTLAQFVDRMSSLEQDMAELQEINYNQSLTISQQQSAIDSLDSTIDSQGSIISVLENTIEVLENTDNTTGVQLEILTEDVQAHNFEILTLQVVNNDILDRLTDVEDVLDYSSMAFLATISAPSVTPSDPIVFDDARLNPGGHYDPRSGIYTVPLDGIYQFVFHYWNLNDISSGAYLKVDDVKVAYTNALDAKYDQTAELVIIQSLLAGQQVWISPSCINKIRGTDSRAGFMYSWFSGHLIYAL